MNITAVVIKTSLQVKIFFRMQTSANRANNWHMWLDRRDHSDRCQWIHSCLVHLLSPTTSAGSHCQLQCKQKTCHFLQPDTNKTQNKLIIKQSSIRLTLKVLQLQDIGWANRPKTWILFWKFVTSICDDVDRRPVLSLQLEQNWCF